MASSIPLHFQIELSESFIHTFYCSPLPLFFSPEQGCTCNPSADPALYTLDLHEALAMPYGQSLQKSLKHIISIVPVLLYVPKFSTQRLLFHYDGTPNSAELIRKFLHLFQLNITDSIATIVSPSFIPKSKLREEQELIQLIRIHTKETSFIKFNFSKIRDFWSYATQQQCTLLVTSKANQIALTKVFFQVDEDQLLKAQLSFYLSI